MKTEPTTQMPAISPLSSSDLLGWLRAKLIDAESTLKARMQMEATWRGGTDESWKAVGCKTNKAERLKESERHGRIASRCRHDVEMFKAFIAAISQPNARAEARRENSRA
jgi:hypothetical protein